MDSFVAMERRLMIPRLTTSLIFSVAIPICSGMSVAQDRGDDHLTRQLFEQYVANRGKINGESVLAATHLVAERGRENGFWKSVLAELKRNDEQSEIGCVRVLGKMLATDAAARVAIRRRNETGEITAWVPMVCLGHEVVTELLNRAYRADRFRIDHYTIALARSRVPETKEFFQSILRVPVPNNPFTAIPASQGHLESTRFHAAVGLSQLGEFEGVDWMIANCEDTTGHVMNAWPKGATRGGGLDACCVDVLRQMSDEQARKSKADWAAWRLTADMKSLLNHVVVFGDP